MTKATRQIDFDDDGAERAKYESEKKAALRLVQEARLLRTRQSLRRWQTRAKRARTAIRKLNLRVRYYERQLGASS